VFLSYQTLAIDVSIKSSFLRRVIWYFSTLVFIHHVVSTVLMTWCGLVS